jgi:archaellum component FlaC
MKKWLAVSIVLVVVLIGATAVNAVFYTQQNTRLNELQASLGVFSGNLNTLQNSVGDLSGGLDTLNGNLAALDPKINALDSGINSVKNDVTGLQGDVTGILGNVNSLQSNVTALKEVDSGLQGSITGLEGDVTGLKGVVTGIDGDIGKLGSDLAAAGEMITTVSGTVGELQGNIEEISGSVSAIQAKEEAIHNIVNEVSPSVVYIMTVTGPLTMASGSGVIIDSRGYVLTAYHVVSGAVSILVAISTGETFIATLLSSNENLDLAVLKMNTPRTDFKAATLGSSANTRVGDEVVAIGYPLSLPGQASFTSGIVSAIRNELGVILIQSDAAVNPGNSGGPLVNTTGEVIGIADFVMLYSDEPVVPADNMGFFVAVEQAVLLIAAAVG